MAVLTRELGVDLGTSNIVFAEGNQVLLQEPTMVAVLVDEDKMVEWGQAAKDMVGRVPDTIEIISPVQHGVIAEYEITETLLGYLTRKIVGPMRVFRPRMMIAVPYGVTSVEGRAVHEAGIGAGSREVFLVAQPIAAGLGVDLPISTPSGNMVISLGGGVNQVAVISLNGIVAGESSRTGGQVLDEAIITYVRKRFGVIIGQPTAELIKIKIGAAIPQDQQLSIEVQGQDQITSFPRPVILTTDDVVEALQEPMEDIVKLTRKVMEKTPPELISDIIDRGAAMCGGGSLLRGIDKYLTKSIGIPVYLVDNPLTCTAEGAVKAIQIQEQLKKSISTG
ncbi:MAG: rod shape-determining protein [Anaerolineaceae bacterium]